MAAPLLLRNIGQLLTLRHPRPDSLAAFGPRRGAELNTVGLVENGAVLCTGGKIVAAGRERDVLRQLKNDPELKRRARRMREVDCDRGVVLPGFVDSHTHLIFAAPRLLDFEKRIAGATYEEIAASGGGIRSSVEGVRNATKSELQRRASVALNEMLSQGTTTVEAKSGYGLNVASEVKSLEAIAAADAEWPGTIIPTLLGAHVVPAEFIHRRAEYVRIVCEEMIPRVARRKLAQFVDVFCERGAFTLDETELIFEAATRHELGVRAHVGQFSETNLEALLRFAPASLDHMDRVADRHLPMLAQFQTIATLLPGANYFLGISEFPNARRLIDANAAISLATDYNPGTSPTPSMPFVLSLACTHMRMTPAEAISAATINAAHALRQGDRKGSVEVGKDADLAVFAVDDYRELAYWFAVNKCREVIVAGVPLGNTEKTSHKDTKARRN